MRTRVTPWGAFFVACAVGCATASAQPSSTPGVAQGAPAAPKATASPADRGTEPASDPAGGFPVYYRGEVVWRVYRPLGAISAQERAALASQHLDRLVRDPSVDPRAFELVHGESSSEIVLGDRVIANLTEADAEAAGQPRREMAERALAQLQRLILTTRQEMSLRSAVVGIGWALLATVAFLLVWVVVVRASRLALARVEELRGHGEAEPRDLLTTARLAAPVGRLVRAVRFTLLAAATLLWLQAVLTALPWTRPYARRVFGYLLDPLRYLWNGFVVELPDLFFLLVIGAVAVGLVRLVHLAFVEIERGRLVLPGFPEEWAQPTYKLVRLLLVALAVVVAYPYIPGSRSPAFQGVSIFLGLLVSLSSSSAISNIIAGTILTYTRGFRLGDRVRIADATGNVVDKSLFVTRVRTPKNVVVSIPNSLVIGSPIVNYSQIAAEHGLILHTTVTIGYDAPWRTVHGLLVAAALATDGVLNEPAPFVWQTALNDFYVSYEINVYTREADEMLAIYSALHASIQDRFNEAGVEIMSPHFSALRDGNRIAIPDEYVGPGYDTPAFRVSGPKER